jgi:hypothetical protein
MNKKECDFTKLENYELQVAVDNILEKFGFAAVIEELEHREFKEGMAFFEARRVANQ